MHWLREVCAANKHIHSNKPWKLEKSTGEFYLREGAYLRKQTYEREQITFNF